MLSSMNVKKMITACFLFIFLGCSLAGSIAAQNGKPDKKAEKAAREKEREEAEKALKAYTGCAFAGSELAILRTDRITKKKEESLSRQTPEGIRNVSRTDSYRVMIGFLEDDGRQNDPFLGGSVRYFANVRPDRSKPEEYPNDNQVVIGNLKYYISVDKALEIREPQEKQYNGFTTYSIYRSALTGNSLGQSLIFDDANKIITTVYFLNMPTELYGKHFKTIDEWKNLREKFLESYTKCIDENLKK